MSTLPKNSYRCRSCGSTSYQRLTHRGPDGAMRYSGVIQCSGCPLQFSDLQEWRERRLRPRVKPVEDAVAPDATGASGETP
jgi:Fe-S cluster biogenesis protein NfuA